LGAGGSRSSTSLTQLLKLFDKSADRLHHRDQNLSDLLNKLLLAVQQKQIDETAINSTPRDKPIEADNLDC
jgi:hypothetical protein